MIENPIGKIITQSPPLAKRASLPTWAICLIVILSTMSGFFSSSVNASDSDGKKTIQNTTCQVQPLPTWSRQEKWIWSKVCLGLHADFNESGEWGGDLNPNDLSSWPDSRVITTAFLEDILLQEPYQSAMPRRGIELYGAWFKDDVDLSYARINHSIRIYRSRFDGELNLDYIQASRLLYFEDTRVAGKFSMNSALLEHDLWIEKGKLLGYVFFGRSVFKHGLVIRYTDFSGSLNLNTVQINGSLYFIEDNFNGGVDLLGAKIGGNITNFKSRCEKNFSMEIIQVKGHIYLNHCDFKNVAGNVNLNNSNIGGSLFLYGSSFKSLELNGAHIGNDIMLVSNQGFQVEWMKDAILMLRNTNVKNIIDSKNAWPPRLVLDGLSFSQFGSHENSSATRDIDWLLSWLGKQTNFSVQPYEYLSAFLLRNGELDKANEVLYRSKEKLRLRSDGLSYFSQSLLKYVVGYGYHMFRSLIWISLFITIGFLVIFFNPAGKEKGSLWCLIFSLDKLLPIIKLDDENYNFKIKGSAKYYYYFHTIIGYVLASFLVAGISGLAK